MKKCTLLSLLLLFCTTAGWAQTLTQLAPDEITAGKRIVLRGVANNNTNYFNGGTIINFASLNTDRIFVVENAETNGKIVLKRETTGSYVAKPTDAAGNKNLVTMCTDKSGAAEFAPTAANYNNTDLTSAYTFDKEKLMRFVTTATNDADTYLNTNGTSQVAQYFNGTGNWGIWAVYDVPEGTELSTNSAQAFPKVNADGASTWYLIRSYRSSKYLAYTGDASNLTQSATLDENALWSLTADGTTADGLKVKIHNAATENLLAGTSSFTAEGASWYIKYTPYNEQGLCISLSETLGSDCLDANNNNDGIGTWQPSSSDNQGTTWQFVSLTDYAEAALTTPDYLTTGEAKATLTNALAAYETTQSKENAITLLNAAYTIEANKALSTGYYTLQTPGRNNNYMVYSTNGNPLRGAASVTDLKGVWKFERQEGEGLVYTLQNAYSGRYMAKPTGEAAGGHAVQESEDPVTLNVIIINNQIAIGGTETYSYAHLDAGGTIVGWNSAADASNWTPATIDESALTSYVTASANGLFDVRSIGCVGGPTAEAAAPIQEAVANFASQEPSLDNFYTLRTTVENTTFEDDDLVQLVSGGLYRIQNYQRKISTGNTACNGDGGYLEAIDPLKPAHANSTAAGFAPADQDESSADALWQFVPVETEEGAYKLYNPNSGTYITQTTGSQSISQSQDENQAATFRIGGYDGYPGQSYIECVERAGVNNRYFHSSGLINAAHQSASLMYYTSAANGPSAWYIRPASTLDVTLTDVNGTAWASTMLPVEATLPDGVTAYTGELDEANGTLKLTALGDGATIPANTPVILESSEAGTKSFDIAPATKTLSNGTNDLQGCLRYTELTDETRNTYFVLGVSDEQAGLYLPGETLTAIPGNKAFLNNAAAQNVKGFAFSFGESTGIDQITTDTDTENAPVYDLSGRRVSQPTHGVYIQGGKKIYIK